LDCVELPGRGGRFDPERVVDGNHRRKVTEPERLLARLATPASDAEAHKLPRPSLGRNERP
jgi:hypothetical protein